MTNVPNVGNILSLADALANLTPAPPQTVEVETLTRSNQDRVSADKLLGAQMLDLDTLFLALMNRALRASTAQEAEVYARLALRCQYQAAVTLKALAP